MYACKKHLAVVPTGIDKRDWRETKDITIIKHYKCTVT